MILVSRYKCGRTLWCIIYRAGRGLMARFGLGAGLEGRTVGFLGGLGRGVGLRDGDVRGLGI